MGCGEPPALAGREEGQDRHSLTTKPSGADDSGQHHGSNTRVDSTSFPFSLSCPHFPQHDLQGDSRSYASVINNDNIRLRGYVGSNSSTSSETNANSINVKNETSEHYRKSEMPTTDYHKSESHINFMPQSFVGTATCYPIKAHGAEARHSRISGAQTTGNFSSSSALPLVDNFVVAENKNDSNVVPLPLRLPQKVDGSFLTLGIGGSTEVRSNNNFSTREIANKLEDAESSRCNSSFVGRSPDKPLSITQLMGRDVSIQNSAGGLSSSVYNLIGEDTSSRLSSVPVPRLQTPQSNSQSNFTARYDNSVFGSTPSSLPHGSNVIYRPEYATPPWLLPEMTNSTHFASQSISGKQDYHRQSTVNMSSESSRNYLSERHIDHTRLFPPGDGRRLQGSSVFRIPVSGQPAKSTSTEYADFGSSTSSVQRVGNIDDSRNIGSAETLRNTLYPERTSFQVSNGIRLQSVAAAGQFPSRLGVQPNDFVNARTIRGPPPIHLPTAPPKIHLAPPPTHLAPPVNPYRPIVLSGQYQHDMPAQMWRDFPRVDYSQGHVIPGANFAMRPRASPIVPRPSLKRQKTDSYPTPHLSQRRKIFPQPVLHHYTTHQRPGVPASPTPIPARYYTPPTPSHIKWQGVEGIVEPIGEKCMLCKKDLSFTAEGPVFQPTIPPGAAVLPCGHTFHDHCLQKITPKDQSKSPPCIPCAVGET